ncbi:MAG: M56 family metallopeptidase [Planctomycetaceae bacterium]
MMNLEYLLPLSNELCLRLALTLFHFLWQGLLVGVAAMLGARLLRSASASLRYLVFTIALLSLPVCVVITFQCIELPPGDIRMTSENAAAAPPAVDAIDDPPLVTPSANVEAVYVPYSVPEPVDVAMTAEDQPLLASSNKPTVTTQDSPKTTGAAPWAQWATYVVAVYLTGVGTFLFRLLLGVWGGHRLWHAAQAVENAQFLRVLADETKRMGLWMTPTLGYCSRVAVPTVVGVLRPALLLPVSLATGLSQEQFAAIVSHELAHIRRYDLLLNLVQRLLESLLFFHPVVWYLSHRMSVEREVSCDELVVSVGHVPASYADALLKVAELCALRIPENTYALAASGHNDSEFAQRIRRLVFADHPTPLRISRGSILVAALLLILPLVISPMLLNVFAQNNDSPAQREEVDSEDEQANADEPELEIAIGMTFKEVVAAKGKHYRLVHAMKVGQVLLVYDDIMVTIDERLTPDGGTVTGVAPTDLEDAEFFTKDIPYADAIPGRPDLADEAFNKALQELHALLAERTKLKLVKKYHEQFLKEDDKNDTAGRRAERNKARSELIRIADRFDQIAGRIVDLHASELQNLEPVAEHAVLECSEEPRYGQPSYGVIVYALSTQPIAADELLLFYGEHVYRIKGEPFTLKTKSQGFYFRPNVSVAAHTRFVVSCIQDAPEEIENVRKGFMPNSDRARDPQRAYRTELYHPQGQKMEELAPPTPAMTAYEKLREAYLQEPDRLHAIGLSSTNHTTWQWLVYIPRNKSWMLYGATRPIPHQHLVESGPNDTRYRIPAAQTGRIVLFDAALSIDDDGKSRMTIRSDQPIIQGTPRADWLFWRPGDPEPEMVGKYVAKQLPVSSTIYYSVGSGRVTTKINDKLELVATQFVPKDFQGEVMAETKLPGFCIWIEAGEFDPFVQRLNELRRMSTQNDEHAEVIQKYEELIAKYPEHSRRAEAMFDLANIYEHSIPQQSVEPQPEKTIAWLGKAFEAAKVGSPIWFESGLHLNNRVFRTKPEVADQYVETMLQANPDIVTKMRLWNARQNSTTYRNDFEEAEQICRMMLDIVKSDECPAEGLLRRDFFREVQSSVNNLMMQWAQTPASRELRKQQIETLASDYPFQFVGESRDRALAFLQLHITHELPISPQPPLEPAKLTAPEKGLEFLSGYPKLYGLSLNMTQQQLLELIVRENLQASRSPDGPTYSIPTDDGYVILVMFGNNEEKCSGIQRIRAGANPMTAVQPNAPNPFVPSNTTELQPEQRGKTHEYVVRIDGPKGAQVKMSLSSQEAGEPIPRVLESKLITLPHEHSFRSETFRVDVETIKGLSQPDGGHIDGSYRMDGEQQGGGFGGTFESANRQKWSFGNLDRSSPWTQPGSGNENPAPTTETTSSPDESAATVRPFKHVSIAFNSSIALFDIDTGKTLGPIAQGSPADVPQYDLYADWGPPLSPGVKNAENILVGRFAAVIPATKGDWTKGNDRELIEKLLSKSQGKKNSKILRHLAGENDETTYWLAETADGAIVALRTTFNGALKTEFSETPVKGFDVQYRVITQKLPAPPEDSQPTE